MGIDSPAAQAAAAAAMAAQAHAAGFSLASARALGDVYNMATAFSTRIQNHGLAHAEMLLLAAAACSQVPCTGKAMHQFYYDAQLCTEIVAEYTRIHMPGTPQATLADAAWRAAVFTKGGDGERLNALHSAACDLFRAARL